MNWLKKILFIMDDKDEMEYREPAGPPHGQARKRQRPVQPEMETRMTYQYPKGQFRFPLIKDPPPQPQATKRSRDGRRTIQEDQEPKDFDIKPKVSTNEERQVDPLPANKKVEPLRRQPFQPGTVPSPVFGYIRPNKNHQEELEYELQDSFLGNLEETATIEESELLTEEISVREKDIGHEPPASMFLDPEMVGEENIEEQTLTKEAVTVSATENEHHTEWKTNGPATNTEAEVRLDLTETDVIKEINEAEKTQEVRADSESQGQPEGQERMDRQERQHLPFNVLMLSQDRKKWQNKQSASPRSEEAASHSEPERRQEQPSGQEKTEEKLHCGGYHFPMLTLLDPPVKKPENRQWMEEQAALLDETLENFNVNARVVHVSQGPSVTRFEVQPEPGVKVNKITNLSDDIKLSMAARDIRMEAPIPGKRSIGIELPNHESRPVQISEILDSSVFSKHSSPLTAALGLDISGAPVVTDLRKMPHGLIAGATGSGKSVCINSILVSLLYKARPDELKLLLIDPKMVELAPYNHIPHLVSPVITDVKAATAALKWAVEEMERRYELFAHASVRDIGRFNEMAAQHGRHSDKLPYIVIVIDELADLMMMSPADVEESICRIAQKARACGIHLIIATQRPSVDVITGLIKANVPTRIAFSVSSQVDSRTIIDISGAEKLLGRGDMLLLDNGSSKPVRLQGTYVSDLEIDRVIEHVRGQGKPDYLFEQDELLKKAQIQEDEDELFLESCEFVVGQGSASTSLLQRHFRIGYNRAARLIQMMEEQGIISEARGSKPRDVLIKETELEQLKDTLVQ
ncbi:MAG TPA: DNA translocase FtsK [Bacillaceae bacterium]